MTAAITIFVGTVHPEQMLALLEVAREYVLPSPVEVLIYGVPAGFLVAAIVWMPRSGR